MTRGTDRHGIPAGGVSHQKERSFGRPASYSHPRLTLLHNVPFLFFKVQCQALGFTRLSLLNGMAGESSAQQNFVVFGHSWHVSNAKEVSIGASVLPNNSQAHQVGGARNISGKFVETGFERWISIRIKARSFETGFEQRQMDINSNKSKKLRDSHQPWQRQHQEPVPSRLMSSWIWAL